MRGSKRFFPEPPVDSPEISVHGVGIQELMRPVIVNRPAGTGDFLLMLFHDEAVVRGREGDGLYPPGTMFVWEPGAAHYYGNPDREWRHSWLHCDGNIVHRTILEAALDCPGPVKVSDPAAVDRHLQAILFELTGHPSPSPVITANLVRILMHEAARPEDEADRPAVPEEMLAVRTFMDTRFQERIDLYRLAGQAGLAVPYFCSRFKACFGCSAMDYLRRIRLGQAGYLLRDCNLSISEIARQVGFGDLYQFSRAFKRHYGLSPRQMRARLTGGES